MLINYNRQRFNNKLCYKIDMVDCEDSNLVSKQFEDFLELWKDLYEKKIRFCFLFDTSSLTKASVEYCYRFANFLKSMKTRNIQYLDYSIIIITNRWIRWWFNFLLKIEQPLAKIYVVKNKNEANELIDYLTSNSCFLESFLLVKKINIVHPS